MQFQSQLMYFEEDPIALVFISAVRALRVYLSGLRCFLMDLNSPKDHPVSTKNAAGSTFGSL